MTKIRLNTWNQFSQQYLSQEVVNKTIRANKLSFALQEYIKQYPAIRLSQEGRTVLRNYAFQKVGHVYNKKALLTQADASEIFKNFVQILSSLKYELNSNRDMTRSPKPQVSNQVNNLSILSATVVENYLEPQQKDKAQHLLNQAKKVHQVAKNFGQHNAPLKPNLPPREKITSNMTAFIGGKLGLNPENNLSLEILAKQLAYYNAKTGEIYQIPYNGQMIQYRVEEIPVWMGLSAYGFKPVNSNDNAPSILVFSGTRIGISARGFLASFTADLDPRGVGYIAYKNGKEAISKWLSQVQGKAVVTGHSLGGALARYTTIDYPHLIEGAVTFSVPGIANKYADKWKKMERENPSLPYLYNFNHIEDKVPTLGQKHLGKNYQVICAVDKTVNKKTFVEVRATHYKRVFSRKVALFCEMQPKKKASDLKQKVLTIIPFIFMMTMLHLSRVLFGIQASAPYTSVFGPVRWVVRQIVTKALANKYPQPQRRCLAAAA